jgi:hypothetical protein
VTAAVVALLAGLAAGGMAGFLVARSRVQTRMDAALMVMARRCEQAENTGAVRRLVAEAKRDATWRYVGAGARGSRRAVAVRDGGGAGA